MNILRDTGAAQSLVLRRSVPDNFVFMNDNFVLLGGFPNTVASYPLEKLYLETDYFQGSANFAVVDSLPVPNIDILFANDLAVSTECDIFPILTMVDLVNDQKAKNDFLNPIFVMTRSRAREVDLSDVELDSEVIDKQVSDFETIVSSDDDNINFQGIDWDAKAFKEAQQNEFRVLEIDDCKDVSKPVFLKENGLIYRASRSLNVPADQVEVVRQLVIPEKYRSRLLYLSHEHNLAGHFGVRKTFQKLAQHFFWPQMRRDIKRHVLSCKVCQLVGKPNQKIPKAPLIPVPSVGEPFGEIVIDVVGPLPRTRGGNEYLLTMVDRVTRFPEAIPLRSIRSEKIVEALVSFFTKFGIPKTLQSDCGTNFTSRFFRKKMSELGVHHVTSSPYHPESQGQVERFHQTLKSVIKKFCIETGNEWDKEVPFALFAIRSVPNETLGFSPFDLVFGHSVHGPLEVVREHWEGEAPEVNVLDYVSGLQEKLRKAWVFAQQNLFRSQAVMKANYDVGTKVRVFKPGDRVLVLLPLPGNPLKAQFSGPWKVLRKLNDVNYLIETPTKRRKSRICHVNMLKQFVDRKTEEVDSVEVDPISLVNAEVVDPMVNEKMSINPDTLCSNTDILNNISIKFQHLDSEKSESLISLIDRYRDLFQEAPGRTTILEHDVDIGDSKPIKQCPYRLHPLKRNIVQEEVRYMLDHDLIEPSCSPWSSPVVLVKKEGGQHRLCFDYRKVNAVTKTDSFPLPRVEDCIDRVGSAKFITKLDLLKGYWQIGLSPRARQISAFVTGDGLYECKVMPFGMKNAAATFQRLMNRITQELEGCIVYIDDLIIFSDDWETHLKRLEALFQALRKAGLVVNLKKSDFAQAKVIYLGHEVGMGKVAPKRANVEAVTDFPAPQNRRGVRRFLGMVGYYRRFIKNFSEIATPLTNLLRKNVKFVWTKECEEAFEKLKAVLISYPLLQSPNFDLPFRLATDASDVGLGAVLLQEDDSGNVLPVAYFSRKLSPAETKYSTIEKEALCLIKALTHFSVYLSSSLYPVMIYTDHNPLVFIQRFKDKNMRLLRWSLFLQEYDIQIKHIAGRDNVIPDVLSRSFHQ